MPQKEYYSTIPFWGTYKRLLVTQSTQSEHYRSLGTKSIHDLGTPETMAAKGVEKICSGTYYR